MRAKSKAGDVRVQVGGGHREVGSLLLCCLRAAEKFRIWGQDEPARMTGTASWAEPFMFQPEARTALEGDWTLLSHQGMFSIGRD